MITIKECNDIFSLLNLELWAYKKCQLYSKTLFDTELSSLCLNLALSHKKRYNALLNLLEKEN